MTLVFDASTLILLAKTTLLREVAEVLKVTIPEIMESECLAKDSFDAALIKQLIQEQRIEVRLEKDEKGIGRLRRDFRVGAGEAGAIWLAKSLNFPLAVDDGQAIKTCRTVGQRFVTAIHLLTFLVSEKRMQLPVALEKLAELCRVGRYNRRIIEDAAQRLKGADT